MRSMKIPLLVFLVAGLVLTFSQISMADQVINDDLIIHNSLCIGDGCQDGMAFGFDLLTLKTDIIRSILGITGIWEFKINDAESGGEFFAFSERSSETSPFVIEAGAPTDSFRLDSAGDLGLGVAAPTARLHVNGNAYVSGTMEVASSRKYKSNIRPLESAAARKALKDLQPVRYFHFSDPAEESLGFIAEDVPDLVAANGRRTLNPIDTVALLTKVIQEQQQTIKELSRRIDDLEKGACQKGK